MGGTTGTQVGRSTSVQAGKRLRICLRFGTLPFLLVSSTLPTKTARPVGCTWMTCTISTARTCDRPVRMLQPDSHNTKCSIRCSGRCSGRCSSLVLQRRPFPFKVLCEAAPKPLFPSRHRSRATHPRFLPTARPVSFQRPAQSSFQRPGPASLPSNGPTGLRHVICIYRRRRIALSMSALTAGSAMKPGTSIGLPRPIYPTIKKACRGPF